MSCYLQLSNKSKHDKKIYQNTSLVKDYPTLHKNDLKLSANGLSPEQQQFAWKKVSDYLHKYKSTMIGHQVIPNPQCSGVLGEYLDMHINNYGDPFTQGSITVHTKAMELAVLDYFAELWHLSVPLKDRDQDEAYWGYVMSSGATEANLTALYGARGYLSGKPLLHSEELERSKSKENTTAFRDTSTENPKQTNPNAFTPVAFFSEEAHYCHAKAMDVLTINTFHNLGSGHFPCPLKFPEDYPSSYSDAFLDKNGWPWNVPVSAEGSMYLPALVKLVTAFVSRGYPSIVIFTSGTPFKGNYENPRLAINKLVPILKEHNLYERVVYYASEDPLKCDIRHGFWFHVDGALGAAHLPFLEMAINKGLVENMFPNGFPVFDFRLPEVMSIAMSLHKWFGCPFPSAIYMTRRKNQVKPPSDHGLFACYDTITTCIGSRNGHGVMTLWDILAKMSQHELAEVAARQEKLVNYSLKKLQDLQKYLGEDLWLSRQPGSLFICFKEPREDIRRKYALASDSQLVKSKQDESLQKRRYSHICIMSHVDEKLIGQFIDDLKEKGTFPLQDTSCMF